MWRRGVSVGEEEGEEVGWGGGMVGLEVSD